MSSRSFERVYPYAWGLVATGVVFFLNACGYKVSYSENMLSAVISLGGIFAGFLATIKTLLLTIASDVKRTLHDSGYMDPLLSYLKEGIAGSLLLCLIAMVGFDRAVASSVAHAALIYGFLLFSVAALYRITVIAVYLLSAKDGEG